MITKKSDIFQAAVRAATTKYRNVRLTGHHDEIALHEATIAALVTLATPKQLADARGAAAQAVINYANEQNTVDLMDEEDDNSGDTGCQVCDGKGFQRCWCDL
jgi:hypothetical protein